MRALFFLLLSVGAVHAQQPSPQVQALESKLMQEIGTGLQCTAQAITLQQEVVKLKAELEVLKPKEPAK